MCNEAQPANLTSAIRQAKLSALSCLLLCRPRRRHVEQSINLEPSSLSHRMVSCPAMQHRAECRMHSCSTGQPRPRTPILHRDSRLPAAIHGSRGRRRWSAKPVRRSISSSRSRRAVAWAALCRVSGIAAMIRLDFIHAALSTLKRTPRSLEF